MVGFVVTGPIRDLGSKHPWILFHKYKKSLSPLAKVPHSSMGIFKECFQASCLASSSVGGFWSCTTCESRLRVRWNKWVNTRGSKFCMRGEDEERLRELRLFWWGEWPRVSRCALVCVLLRSWPYSHPAHTSKQMVRLYWRGAKTCCRGSWECSISDLGF